MERTGTWTIESRQQESDTTSYPHEWPIYVYQLGANQDLVNWLRSAFMPAEKGKLTAMTTVYRRYMEEFCRMRQEAPKAKPLFGKYVKKAFPNVRVRRLGHCYAQDSFYDGIVVAAATTQGRKEAPFDELGSQLGAQDLRRGYKRKRASGCQDEDVADDGSGEPLDGRSSDGKAVNLGPERRRSTECVSQEAEDRRVLIHLLRELVCRNLFARSCGEDLGRGGASEHKDSQGTM